MPEAHSTTPPEPGLKDGRTAAIGADLPYSVRQATLRLSLVYWACMFVADSTLGWFIDIGPLESAPFRLLLFAETALLTWGMSALLFRLRSQPFVRKVLCFAMTAVAAPLFSAMDYVNLVLCTYPEPVVFDTKYAAYALIEGASMMFGWSCLFMALLYHFEVREREQHLAAMREEALAAQMRALRYQVNPHLLFNTLNAIAGLIEENEVERAQSMVLSLSAFLHTTLALDPMHDMPLADEIRLQQDYLAIERERFADRMDFCIDVPEPLRQALVPSLLLQPLVENAIKHGVGRAQTHTQIHIRASRHADRLRLVVENDLPAATASTATAAAPGFGIGLRNVAERIRMRFGAAGSFRVDAGDGTRFVVEIELPWQAP